MEVFCCHTMDRRAHGQLQLNACHHKCQLCHSGRHCSNTQKHWYDQCQKYRPDHSHVLLMSATSNGDVQPLSVNFTQPVSSYSLHILLTTTKLIPKLTRLALEHCQCIHMTVYLARYLHMASTKKQYTQFGEFLDIPSQTLVWSFCPVIVSSTLIFINPDDFLYVIVDKPNFLGLIRLIQFLRCHMPIHAENPSEL